MKNDKGEEICPNCGTVLIVTPWWDDPRESGGAVIGYQFDCPNCGYHDSQ
jgi:predicted RNA-binding Zn-ribbon protein involved in translation (DUF1610 family)